MGFLSQKGGYVDVICLSAYDTLSMQYGPIGLFIQMWHFRLGEYTILLLLSTQLVWTQNTGDNQELYIVQITHYLLQHCLQA